MLQKKSSDIHVYLLALLVPASFGVAGQNSIAAAACGPESLQFDVNTGPYPPALPKPEPGNALVYVVEDQVDPVCLRCVETARIGFDGKWVGANRLDSWLSFQVQPGEHHLCADLQGRRRLRFDPKRISVAGFKAEPGAVYYFIARVTHTAYLGPLVDLEPMNRDEGEFLVSSYYPSSSRARK